jgi:hypothetical protein
MHDRGTTSKQIYGFLPNRLRLFRPVESTVGRGMADGSANRSAGAAARRQNDAPVNASAGQGKQKPRDHGAAPAPASVARAGDHGHRTIVLVWISGASADALRATEQALRSGSCGAVTF